MSHCCQSSHYTFDILKCGETTCTICSPIRLPGKDIFKKLCHIPHPTPGHYLSFADVFDSKTTEEHRPSYKKPSSITKKE